MQACACGIRESHPNETELPSVYHLLDTTFDDLEGSWRQLAFPRDYLK